jgi:hypothetical protein
MVGLKLELQSLLVREFFLGFKSVQKLLGACTNPPGKLAQENT